MRGDRNSFAIKLQCYTYCLNYDFQIFICDRTGGVLFPKGKNIVR